MKCALIEFNYYHDETLPSLVYLLNRIGIVPDVYLPVRAARKDPFAYARSLRWRRFFTDGLWAVRGTPSRFLRYEFAIFNSVEPPSVLHRAAANNVPTLAVLHNADLPAAHSEYAAYFSSPARRPIVLWGYIAEALGSRLDARWIAPVYLGDTPQPPSRRGPVTFCVQGNLEYSRRNYQSLLQAVSALRHERRDFKVSVVGRSDGLDGLAFKREVARADLGRFFSFTSGEIGYRDYFARVAAADFLLPLIDASSERYSPYFRCKLTSSMSLAIGLGVVPIAHTRLATLYRVAEGGLTYEDGGLADAMRQALADPPDVHEHRRHSVASVKSRLLVESEANLREAVAGLPGARPEAG